MEHLKQFLEKLKTLGFFQRLFGWGDIKSQLIDAYSDLQKLMVSEEHIRQNLLKKEQELSLEKNDNKNLRDTFSETKGESLSLKEAAQRLSQEKEDLQKKIATLEEKNDTYYKRGIELKQKSDSLEVDLQLLREQNTKYKTTEEQRKQGYETSIANVNKLTEDVRKERAEEINLKHRNEVDRLSRLKETWSNHEENVRIRIKTISNRHGIEYVDKVPFKGSPDNTLKINDEYIVFDAKSPGSDDLSNFPTYLKNQVEGAIKYVKEEDVRRELFLVVPTNTLEGLEQFEYRLADYSVFIISIEALEPIMLALKKIEDYEFAEQLSPEERENICRVIGKFVHLSKRRIQIDGFFAKQFFELVYRSEADLPRELLAKAAEFEKSDRLNPPTEKRAKQISIKELEADNDKLKSEANQKGIITQDSVLSKEINKLPLYSTENEAQKYKDQGKLFSQE